MTAAHTCMARNRAGRIQTVVAHARIGYVDWLSSRSDDTLPYPDARALQSAPGLDMPQQPACRRFGSVEI